ncbi:hypothetical protein LV79_003229 [Actinokineospora globicatena]|nr:hypothetical protein [Actinokineospora globicatena]
MMVAAVDWSGLRTCSGSGEGLPTAFDALHAAATPESADAAYWMIDNEVVVQGSLFEAAEPALAVLLSLSGEFKDGPRLRALVELVQQIVCGVPADLEDRSGNTELGDRCRRQAREGLTQFYGWLLDEDPSVRECALLIIDAVDPDRARKQSVLAVVGATEQEPNIRRTLQLITNRD